MSEYLRWPWIDLPRVQTPGAPLVAGAAGNRAASSSDQTPINPQLARPLSLPGVAALAGILGYAPVRRHNRVVGVTQSQEDLAAPLNQLFLNVLYSVLLVGAVLSLLAILFLRSIVGPIRQLTGAVHAPKKGDYGKAHIRVKCQDEIGQPARTFNVMIDVLRRREREHGAARRERSRHSPEHGGNRSTPEGICA